MLADQRGTRIEREPPESDDCHRGQFLARAECGGDLTARSGLGYGGEMGDLARAFDEMAAALERREAERRVTEETLRASETRTATVPRFS